MTDAKDPDWIQDAEEDIKKRGTEGKCTPITKKGCTGKAKTLAKTFKKMAKKKKNEAQYDEAFEPGSSDNEDSDSNDSSPLKRGTAKPVRQARARAEAGKPIKKGTASTVANDSGSEMSQRMKAAEKM